MGGGGDDGYEAKQQAIEDKKQAARDRLNLLFGVSGETIGKPKAVDRESFMREVPLDPSQNKTGLTIPYGTPASYSPMSVIDEPRGGETTALGTARVLDQGAYDGALAQAQATADSEMAQIDANKAAREGLYQSVRDNAFTAGKRRIDEENTDAKRKLKFELFARGLNAGSEDIDQNSLRERTYKQGLMDLGAKADSTKAGFRGDDETTRLQLLQSIDAGMDQGSALSAATGRMQVAADKASADAMGTTMGDLFSNAGLIYDQGQLARGRQAAASEWWNSYAPAGKRSTGSTTGVTTRLPGE